ncbi:HD domain-containing protein [Robertkochia marina]|uniref:HD domain-containing protein n=1 Tax=Robertkochia marina TaxID=1227945 RepID=A0A4S3M0J3_9FLAO|nr:HD domain-containing protein [Robertkochia marina]THD67940.1 HD domain-containing protein [Robertkochia marina]TRZ41052.1 HD domain-containing protein [Robertkochia marina]
MNTTNKLKIFNDPIYGFITIPNPLIFDLIEHRYFQRLRRISQMGLSYLVYPGAHHTRFHHAIGCMHLMTRAVRALRFKQVSISDAEEQALQAAILLHDIGHGPFSHAMEHSIVNGVSHERISLRFMELLNKEFDGALDLAIRIFKGEYHRKFMYQLISGQLDMDRADYLKRDSFYTGVSEGNINSERIITMLNVVDDELVVEEKGIYSIEKFLVARRLMYWQVYLHKTGLVAEQLLIRMLQRAKYLVSEGRELPCTGALKFFLDRKIGPDDFDEEVTEHFSRLDDVDIQAAMKDWQYHDDALLSALCRMLLDRKLLKIKVKKKPFKQERKEELVKEFMECQGWTEEEARFLVFDGVIENQAYSIDRQNINILMKSGKIKDVAKASDQFNLRALSKPVTKYYLCHPK